MMWDRDGCWWEKDWDRPRLAWCRSSRSRTAGLDGLFLPEAWGETNKKQNYHFLFVIKSTDRSQYPTVPCRQLRCAHVTTAERQVGGWTRTPWTVASASCADSAAESRHGTGHVNVSWRKQRTCGQGFSLHWPRTAPVWGSERPRWTTTCSPSGSGRDYWEGCDRPQLTVANPHADHDLNTHRTISFMIEDIL